MRHSYGRNRQLVLCFPYLEVLHKDGDDDVDENKLRHEHEDNKKHRSDERTHTAVAKTIVARVAVVTQRVLTTDMITLVIARK